MQRTLNQLLKDAVERKPRRLSFDTTYSHNNIYDWLKTILNDWTIIIPGDSCSTFALSDWPAIGITRNSVKRWLEEKNHHKPDDLIDGACEPLAYYLSSSISNLNLSSPLEVAEEPESRYLSPNIYKQTKDILDQLEPRLAAEVIFGNYIKQETQSPQFWHEEFGNTEFCADIVKEALYCDTIKDRIQGIFFPQRFGTTVNLLLEVPMNENNFGGCFSTAVSTIMPSLNPSLSAKSIPTFPSSVGIPVAK